MLSRSALDLANQVQHPLSLAAAHIFAGTVAWLARDEETAWREAETTLAISRAQALPFFTAWAELLQAVILTSRGDDAEQLIKSGFGVYAASGTRFAIDVHRTGLATAYLAAKRPDRARGLLADAGKAAPEQAEPYLVPERLRLVALLSAADGDAAAAEDGLRNAVGEAEKLGTGLWRLRASRDLAALLGAQNRPQEARAVLREALAGFGRGEPAPEVQGMFEALRAFS